MLSRWDPDLRVLRRNCILVGAGLCCASLVWPPKGALALCVLSSPLCVLSRMWLWLHERGSIVQNFVSRKIEARAAIRRAVRSWFEGQGFLEVETPARVPSPGQEVHLEAIPAGDERFLITSPEYHMKRLVAAGLPRIVQICRCWRAASKAATTDPSSP